MSTIRAAVLRTARPALISTALCLVAIGAPATHAAAQVRGVSPAGAVGAFVPIVEPFDPGHQARTTEASVNCGAQVSTVDIQRCLNIKAENTDARVDAAQSARWLRSSPAARAAINADDSKWLAVRKRVCEAAYDTGGTINIVDVARCQLAESTARLSSVTGAAVPKATLPETDSIDLSQLAYYTTPAGSRIAEIDTQGDETGGTVVAWVIIGGYRGFTVNPAQFFYKDGPFTDTGVVEPPNPPWHQVQAGAVYQFSIDYSTISHDPHADKGNGGYVYAPGGDVLAEWTGTGRFSIGLRAAGYG